MIIQGRIEDVLVDCPEGLFDGVLTDPPYALKLMNNEWDRMLPTRETWALILKCCLPGAPLLAFGHPKTFHRLACNIEDGGWVHEDLLMWLNSQGSPKSKGRLKPGFEPVALAVAPGTPLKLNIDPCRVPRDPDDVPGWHTSGADGSRGYHGTSTFRTRKMSAEEIQGRCGGKDRWPSTVLLDEGVAALVDEQHPGASRFYYCAKASKREKGGTDHPTVKPAALCSYLATLMMPQEGIRPRTLLVPYAGSGSEVIGALRAGWDSVVAIEMNEQFCADAEARVTNALNELATK